MKSNTGTQGSARAPAPLPEAPAEGALASTDALAPTLGCLHEDEILAYRDGQTTEAERTRIHEHLDACAVCSDLLLLVVADFAGSSGVGSGVAMEPRAFSAGTMLARRYRVERFVGQGGMGEVYEALDTLLNTRVAIKTVVATACDNLRAARKLFDEVRNAQRVTHPHVCRINELHTHPAPDAPIHFLTMEFIDGETLSARRKRAGGALPHEEVRELARQLLEGLCAAHAKGVVHLDFKSDNVMLRSNLRSERSGAALDAVIMDFGLSRALDSDARLRTSERSQLAGTLRYMAPEQLECRPDIGPAADVYAFGVVLYESLTGKLPFEGSSLSSILIKQLKHTPPPPSKVLPGLSPAVDTFVIACMAPDRAARFADAEAALAAFLKVGEWRSTRRWPRWRYALASGALAAAVLGGASLYVSFEPLQEPQRSGVTPPALPVQVVEPNAPARAELRAQPPLPAGSLEVASSPAASPPAASSPAASPPAQLAAPPPPAQKPRKPSRPQDVARTAEAPRARTLSTPRVPARQADDAAPAPADSSAKQVEPAPPAAEKATSPERRPRLPGAPTHFLEPR